MAEMTYFDFGGFHKDHPTSGLNIKSESVNFLYHPNQINSLSPSILDSPMPFKYKESNGNHLMKVKGLSFGYQISLSPGAQKNLYLVVTTQ